MPSNWKGKVGAAAAMAGAITGVLHDVAAGEITVEKMLAYWTAFAFGLSQWGIRAAIGVVGPDGLANAPQAQAANAAAKK